MVANTTCNMILPVPGSRYAYALFGNKVKPKTINRKFNNAPLFYMLGDTKNLSAEVVNVKSISDNLFSLLWNLEAIGW